MLKKIARVTIGLAILAALIYSGLIDFSTLAAVLDEPELLVLSGLLLTSTVLIAALRWWILLLRLDFSIPLIWSLRTIFACQFLNTFLPGAYGSDVVRIGLAYRATRATAAHLGRINRLGRIAVTVLVDRLSGLASLVFLALVIMPLLPTSYSNAMYLPLAAISGVIIGGTLFGLLLGNQIAAVLEKFPASICKKLAHAVREVRAALHEYIGRWDALVAAFALSVVQFVIVVVTLMILGHAMEFDALSKIGYAIAGILAIVANAIPLTPGGLGIGETAFAQIAVMLEMTESGASYATVFLTMRVLTVLVSVCGIVPYLALRGEVGRGVEMVAETSAESSDSSVRDRQNSVSQPS